MARGRPLLHAQQRIETRCDTFVPPNNAEYIRDWTRLAPGDQVLMVEKYTPGLSGRVDAVTEDGEILWLHLSNGRGRRIYMRADGALAWRVL